MQANNKSGFQSYKNNNQKLNNKPQSGKQATFQSQAQTQEATESGMVFPETVLVTINCDKKSLYSEVLAHNQQVKLTSQGFGGIATPYIQKVKLYSNKIPNKITLKIQSHGNQYYFHLQKNDITSAFTKLIWLKLATMNIFTDFETKIDDQITGKGLKTDLWGNWNIVYLKLSKKNGLLISNDEKFTSRTLIRSTSQLWTRFEMIENNSYFIVKLWVGLIKYQLGLPICREVTSWMHGFCQMLLRQ